MGSIFIYPGMKIERTPEMLAEIEALENLPDDEIDYSDIPKTTDEEFRQMRRNREIYNELRAQGINVTREQVAKEEFLRKQRERAAYAERQAAN